MYYSPINPIWNEDSHEYYNEPLDNQTGTKKIEDVKKGGLGYDSFDEQNPYDGEINEGPVDYSNNFDFQEEHDDSTYQKKLYPIIEDSFQEIDQLERPRPKMNTKVELKLPGETKNLPKGYARAFAQFIQTTLKNMSQKEDEKLIVQNSTLKQFLKLNPEQIGRQKLIDFLQTDVGVMFGREFFGNCLWSYSLTKESKTQVEPYFRYNITYYEEVLSQPRKLVKK